MRTSPVTEPRTYPNIFGASDAATPQETKTEIVTGDDEVAGSDQTVTPQETTSWWSTGLKIGVAALGVFAIYKLISYMQSSEPIDAKKLLDTDVLPSEFVSLPLTRSETAANLVQTLNQSPLLDRTSAFPSSLEIAMRPTQSKSLLSNALGNIKCALYVPARQIEMVIKLIIDLKNFKSSFVGTVHDFLTDLSEKNLISTSWHEIRHSTYDKATIALKKLLEDPSSWEKPDVKAFFEKLKKIAPLLERELKKLSNLHETAGRIDLRTRLMESGDDPELAFEVFELLSAIHPTEIFALLLLEVFEYGKSLNHLW